MRKSRFSETQIVETLNEGKATTSDPLGWVRFLLNLARAGVPSSARYRRGTMARLETPSGGFPSRTKHFLHVGGRSQRCGG